MLIGIGLGPGSPDLLTLGAVKALKESDKVYVPGKLALELVLPYSNAEILDFPMIKDKNELKKLWEKNAKIVVDEARKGKVSFAVIGDPNTFSTFSHLKRTIKENYPDIEIITIPGVSSITAQASKTDTSIENSFIVSDGSPINTKIILKAKTPQKIENLLKKDGFSDFIFAERLFMENETITKEIPEKGDYFSILIASKKHKINKENKVYFVGAGPGNPKYITVKGRELLDNADLVVYAGSLVNLEILSSLNCEKIDSHGMKLEDIVNVMAKYSKENKTVVRLHSGDPSLYGAIIEQIDSLKKHGIEVEIIPGVTSLFASAASLKSQLTLNGITETLIITRPEGNTLESDSIRELSKHNATLAIYLGTHKIKEITDKIEEKKTPAAVVYHASWDDEKIIIGNVGDISDKVKESGINSSAMIIIGNVLSSSGFKRSHLYG